MKISRHFSPTEYFKNPSGVITVHEKLQTAPNISTSIAAASLEVTAWKDFSFKHYGLVCVEDTD